MPELEAGERLGAATNCSAADEAFGAGTGAGTGGGTAVTRAAG